MYDLMYSLHIKGKTIGKKATSIRISNFTLERLNKIKNRLPSLKPTYEDVINNLLDLFEGPSLKLYENKDY
jgi:predicted DNA-binding protein